MKKRILTFVLTLVMCLALITTSTVAASDDDFLEVTIAIPEIPGLTITIYGAYKTYLYAPEGDGGDMDCVLYNFIIVPETIVYFSQPTKLMYASYNLDDEDDLHYPGFGSPIGFESPAFDSNPVSLYGADDNYSYAGAIWYNENDYSDELDIPYFYYDMIEGGSAHTGASCVMGISFALWDDAYEEMLLAGVDSEDWDYGWYPESIANLETGQTITFGADPWAKSELEQALSIGLIPGSVVNAGWKDATTRLAAADALVRVIEAATGRTMDEIAAEEGWNLSAPYFSDTSSKAATFLGCAGVTNGVGEGKYGPDSEYNRAQMVTMIGRAAEMFFGVDAKGDNTFADDVPDWAAPYVGYAADTGITQGVSATQFNPFGVLQNQHTGVFCWRTFNVFTDYLGHE
jgi:hypothetical protein